MIFLSPPRSSSKGLLQTFMTDDTLVTVCDNSLIGRHSWLPYDRHSTRGFTLEVDQSHVLLKLVITSFTKKQKKAKLIF